MKTIGILGNGQTGNVLADIASNMGFVHTAAINTSKADLDSVDLKNKLKLNGSEGVGKNRNVAQSILQDQYELIIDFVQEHFAHTDIIAVAFSAGGGTGSGMSPLLLDILSNTMPDKVFIALVVMPDESEVTVNQINTLKTFEELSKLNVAVFPIDNQQVKNAIPNIGKNKLYEIVDNKAISLLYKIASYTEKFSKNGNFDKKDFLTVVNTKGIGTISEIDIATVGDTVDLTANGIAKKINESWNQSVFTPIEYSQVTRAGIIFDGQDSLMEYIQHNLLFDKFNNGMPIDLFEGYYHEQNGKVLTILTGLQWCYKRLNNIERALESNKDNVESMLASTSNFISKSGDLMNKIRKTPEKKRSIDDILSRYGK
jgi:cell division GTPase FtsZ